MIAPDAMAAVRLEAGREGLPTMLFQAPLTPAIACVYLLLKEGEVVYVGQTLRLSERLASHQKEKDFDAVFYLPAPPDRLWVLEERLILALQPPLNKTLPNRRQHPRVRRTRRFTESWLRYQMGRPRAEREEWGDSARPGLRARFGKTGTIAWLTYWSQHGKQHVHYLGRYPSMGLADAHRAYEEWAQESVCAALISHGRAASGTADPAGPHESRTPEKTTAG